MLYPQTNAIRLCTSLNGLWQWSYNKTFSDQLKPKLISVPGRFSSHPELRNHQGYLWLRTSFQVNALQLAQRLVLFFESISHGASVYINGNLAVSHHGANQAFEVAINDLVHPGENYLSIYLSNLLDEGSCPAATLIQNENDFHMSDIAQDTILDGGIDGNVFLYSTAWSFVQNIHCSTMWKEDSCDLSVTASLLGFEQNINWYLHDDSKIIGEGSGKNVTFFLKKSTYWHPSRPHCLKLEVQTTAENSPIDHYILPIGLHPLEATNTTNIIQLKAIDNAPLTASKLLSQQSQYLNKKAILISQEPFLHNLLSFCDRMGIQAILELPPYPPKESKLDDSEARLSILKHYINCYQHHPSILAWGLGHCETEFNEENIAPYLRIIARKDGKKRPLFYRSHRQSLFLYPNKKTILTSEIQTIQL